MRPVRALLFILKVSSKSDRSGPRVRLGRLCS